MLPAPQARLVSSARSRFGSSSVDVVDSGATRRSDRTRVQRRCARGTSALSRAGRPGVTTAPISISCTQELEPKLNAQNQVDRLRGRRWERHAASRARSPCTRSATRRRPPCSSLRGRRSPSVTASVPPWRGARTRGDPRTRRPRAAEGRGRGASPAGHPRVRDRRSRRSRVPGGEAPRAERRRVGGAGVAAQPADHRQPRARGAAEGRIGIRSPDLACGSRSDEAAAARAARRARRRRRARARREHPSRLRDARGRRGSAPRGAARLVCAAESAPEAALAGIEPVAVRHLAEVVEYLRGRHRRARLRADRRARDRERRGSRSRRSARPGACPTRARDRCRRLAQPLADGPAGHREDDARPAASGDPPDARARGGARGDAYPLGRRTAPAGRALVSVPPFRAPHHGASAPAIVGGGSEPAPGRGLASRIEACCSWTSCRSSRARFSSRCASRSRTASSRSRASAGTRSSRRGFSSWEP